MGLKYATAKTILYKYRDDKSHKNKIDSNITVRSNFKMNADKNNKKIEIITTCGNELVS